MAGILKGVPVFLYGVFIITDMWRHRTGSRSKKAPGFGGRGLG